MKLSVFGVAFSTNELVLKQTVLYISVIGFNLPKVSEKQLPGGEWAGTCWKIWMNGSKDWEIEWKDENTLYGMGYV